jgi:hypothetical protein
LFSVFELQRDLSMRHNSFIEINKHLLQMETDCGRLSLTSQSLLRWFNRFAMCFQLTPNGISMYTLCAVKFAEPNFRGGIHLLCAYISGGFLNARKHKIKNDYFAQDLMVLLLSSFIGFIQIQQINKEHLRTTCSVIK